MGLASEQWKTTKMPKVQLRQKCVLGLSFAYFDLSLAVGRTKRALGQFFSRVDPVDVEEASDVKPTSWPAGIEAVHYFQRQISKQVLVRVFCHDGQQYCDVVWLPSCKNKQNQKNQLGWW